MTVTNFDEARREEAVQLRLKQMPVSCRGIYRRAVGGRSLRAAIDAFCQECVGYQRREITECTDLGCPLYGQRPKYGMTSEAGETASVSVEGRDGPPSHAESTNSLELVSQGLVHSD